MNAKWSISNHPALAVICLLLWCGSLSKERDTVIIVKYDTVYLQRKPTPSLPAVYATAATTGVYTAIANGGKL